jgi:hypothetical protein
MVMSSMDSHMNSWNLGYVLFGEAWSVCWLSQSTAIELCGMIDVMPSWR